jgi:hypothetical protein
MSATISVPMVSAQSGPGFEEGSRIFTLSGGGSSDQDFNSTTASVQLGLEYQFLFKDSDEAQDAYKDGRFVYELGMGVRW